MIIIAFALAWHVLVFLKMPHLTWIPAFMNTWFYDKGLLYYKDFIQLHFPIPHMVAYPLLKLTNWDILKEPFLALFTAILTTLILYKIAQKYLAPPARTAVLVFFSLLGAVLGRIDNGAFPANNRFSSHPACKSVSYRHFLFINGAYRTNCYSNFNRSFHSLHNQALYRPEDKTF